jgi:hypothetical protein
MVALLSLLHDILYRTIHVCDSNSVSDLFQIEDTLPHVNCTLILSQYYDIGKG